MAHLNYKHLHYFWVVAREGSIVKASKLLHLTPQTISSQLGLLEDAIGAKLFAKSGRNLILTEAGRVAMGYAEEIYGLGDELMDVLRHRLDGRPMPFSVGVVDVVPKLIAARLLEPALELPESMRIICHEDKLENLLADLAVHKLDMVLADGPMRSTLNVRAFNHMLGECGSSFFAAPDLAKQLRREFPQSLDQIPILLPMPGTTLRDTLTQWCAEKQITPTIAGEFDDGALMKTFGQAGAGVFCAPSVIEREVVQQYKVQVIGRTEEVRERFYAITTERRLKHPAVVAISEAAKRRLFGME
ncbi:MAG: transcriptional activator NhaR [Pseudomonadota bacterium]